MYNKTLSALFAGVLLVSCAEPVPAPNVKPVSKITEANSGYLQVASTDDAGTSGLTYAWIVNGEVDSEATYFDASGLAENTVVTLTTTDSDGLSHDDYFVITGSDSNTDTNTNNPPVSSITKTGDFLEATSTDDKLGLMFVWSVNGVVADGVTSKYLNISELVNGTVVTLVTTDSDGESDSTDYTISSNTPVNEAPTAKATANTYVGAAPLSVVLKADDSSDDKGITVYEWRIDGQLVSSNEEYSYTFNAVANYSVELTVKDAEGLSHTDTISINATDPAIDAFPTSVISADIQTGSTPLEVVFDSAGSGDDNGDVTYAWDFGDGSAVANGAIATHTYTAIGEHTATLSVTDSKNQETTASTIITVTAENVAPVAAIDADFTSGDAPLVVNFDGSGSYDLDNSGALTYSWDFDDGSLPSTEQNPSHLFTDGIFDVVLTVSDGEDSHTDTVRIEADEVIALNQAPIARFIISNNNLMVDVDASTSEDPEMFALSYAWEFLDESDAVVSEQSGVNATYTYATVGVKSVRLTVTDVDDLTHNLTLPISVSAGGTVGVGDCSDDTLDFCTDFEDGMLANELTAAQSYEFDDIGYMSNKSVKVTQGAQNFFKITPPAADFWSRVFIRSNGDTGTGKFNNQENQQSSLWGGDTQGFARAHGVLLKGLEGNAQMRIGDHRCQLEINRDGGSGHLGDDLEMTSGNYGENDTVCNELFGARMEVNQWYCLEVHFNGPESEVQVFWDNQNVEQLHVTADRTWTNEDKPPGGMWSPNAGELWGPYNYDYFAFGYESFNNSGDRPNTTFWYDNVAVSTQRVGCGDNYVQNGTLDDSTKLQPTSNGYPYSNDGGTDPGDGGGTDPGDGGSIDPGNLGTGTIIAYENFEGVSTGNIPSDWTLFKQGHVAQSISVVDNKVGAFGSKSLMATASAYAGDMLIVKELPAGHNTIYVRMMMNSNDDIGAPSNGKNHSHFTTLQNDQAMANDIYSVDQQIRVGDAKGTLGLNEKKTDTLYPLNPDWNGHATNYIPGNEWVCVEVAYLNEDPSKSAFKMWVDGSLYVDVLGAEFHNTIAGGDKWLDGVFENVGLGWYDAGFLTTNTLWFDEVVISTDRIGCNPPS